MQIEITLLAPEGCGYQAQDLGFLLHKHPDHMHERSTSAGRASIFYPTVSDSRTTAVLYLDIDPVGLVRGKHRGADGLLDQYVNDRPYVANSFLSVALARAYGQSLSGKSKEKQQLADDALPFEARVTPVAASGGAPVISELFEPLGYSVDAKALDDNEHRGVYDLTISGDVRLRDLLNHLYVLVPVLDNAKHWWIGPEEIDRLLAKGEGWLSGHPAKELIARRALKHRRGLVNSALERLAENALPEEDDEEADTTAPRAAPEDANLCQDYPSF